MTDGFKVTLAQLNPRVGDLDHNRGLAMHAWQAARADESDFLLLPEMFMTGYQVQDLVLKPAFTRDAMRSVESLAARTVDGPAIGIGAPLLRDGDLYNGFHILIGGRIHCSVLKHHLPNTDVSMSSGITRQDRFAAPTR